MLCTDIIKSKISGSSNGGGGGISGGRTVTFKADGQDYAISSVKSGQSISAPDPNPTSESGIFTGWLDGENTITFPYTPSENKILNARFSIVHSEIATDIAGTFINTAYGTKTNNGLAISGGATETTYNGITAFLIGQTRDSVITSLRSSNIKTFDYEGETWYANAFWSNTKSNFFDGAIECYIEGDYTASYVDNNIPIICSSILDYYYRKK